jgi:hypothetical protein
MQRKLPHILERVIRPTKRSAHIGNDPGHKTTRRLASFDLQFSAGDGMCRYLRFSTFDMQWDDKSIWPTPQKSTFF